MNVNVDEVLARQDKQKGCDMGLEEYFSPEELAGVSDCEKKRLGNRKLNYEMMLEIGKQFILPAYFSDDETSSQKDARGG